MLKENEYSDFHHIKVLSPFKKHLQSMCLLLQKNLTSQEILLNQMNQMRLLTKDVIWDGY